MYSNLKTMFCCIILLSFSGIDALVIVRKNDPKKFQFADFGGDDGRAIILVGNAEDEKEALNRINNFERDAQNRYSTLKKAFPPNPKRVLEVRNPEEKKAYEMYLKDIRTMANNRNVYIKNIGSRNAKMLPLKAQLGDIIPENNDKIAYSKTEMQNLKPNSRGRFYVVVGRLGKSINSSNIKYIREVNPEGYYVISEKDKFRELTDPDSLKTASHYYNK